MITKRPISFCENCDIFNSNSLKGKLSRKYLTELYEKLKFSQYELNRGCPLTNKFEFISLHSQTYDCLTDLKGFRIFFLAPLNSANILNPDLQPKCITILYVDVYLNDCAVSKNDICSRYPLLATELFDSNSCIKINIYDPVKLPGLLGDEQRIDVTTSEQYSGRILSTKITVPSNQEALLRERKRAPNFYEFPINPAIVTTNSTTLLPEQTGCRSNEEMLEFPQTTSDDFSFNSRDQESIGKSVTHIRMSMSPPIHSTPPPSPTTSHRHLQDEQLDAGQAFNRVAIPNDHGLSNQSQNVLLNNEARKIQPNPVIAALPNFGSINDFDIYQITKQGLPDSINICRALFQLHGKVFTVDSTQISSCFNAPLCPVPIDFGDDYLPYDIKICPNDTDLLSFIHQRDIYVIDVNSRNILRLTHTTDQNISCGIPSFVTQEEFDRFTGYYWKPTRQLIDYHHHDVAPSFKANTIFKYSLVYEETDENCVETLKIPTNLSDDLTKIQEQKFPRPGTRNSISTLKLVEFLHDTNFRAFLPFPSNVASRSSTPHSPQSYATKQNCNPNPPTNFNGNSQINYETSPGSVQPCFALNSCAELRTDFPSFEYLVRFGWILNTTSIWVQGLNRAQNTLETVILSTDSFKIVEHLPQLKNEVNPTPHSPPSNSTARIPTSVGLSKCQLLYREVSPYWINVCDILHFLTGGSEIPNENQICTLSFICSSEESYYRHLYKLTLTLTTQVENHEMSTSTQEDFKATAVAADGKFPQETPLLATLEPPPAPHTDKLQLTSGEWAVLGNKIWVDEDNSLVYFVGNMDTPLEKHLYVTSFTTLMQPQRITTLGYSHSIHMDKGCTIFIDCYSNLSVPTCIDVYVIRHKSMSNPGDFITAHLISTIHKPDPLASSKYLLPAPEIFDFTVYAKPDEIGIENPRQAMPPVITKNDPTKLYGLLFKPFDFSYDNQINQPTDRERVDGKKMCKLDHFSNAPVQNDDIGVAKSPELDLHNAIISPPSPALLYVYGGPQVQQVTNSYKGNIYLKLYFLSALGYPCIIIDNRGTSNRGLQFESHISRSMGNIEIDDQINGLKYVSEKFPGLVDLNRIAIHGWSYGGYLSLRALLLRPDVFRIAISGAPVTSWFQYDTGYTERYMGLVPSPLSSAYNIPETSNRTPQAPEDFPQNCTYDLCDVIDKCQLFPDEDNRLILVHGLMDENVHFHNTSLLIQNLIKHNKPYRLMVYPNERHGLRCYDSLRHFDVTFAKFLIDNL